MAGTAAAAGVLCAAGCASRAGGDWQFLTAAQAEALALLADEIVPGDDFPSASQAGVMTYIDRQLMGPYRRHRGAYQSGVASANRISREICGVPLLRAPVAGRHAVATALAARCPAFFELLREHAMEGYYGSPRHGGNRNAVSWRMLGLDVPPLRGRAQIGPGRSAAP